MEKAKEKDYEEPKPEDFSEEILKIKSKIKEQPKDAMNYYFLAKEYILKVPLRAIDSLEEVESLLKKSLELAPELWAPKIFLGELLFKQGRFREAEKYFKEVIKEKPESVSVREYLGKCVELGADKKNKKHPEKELLYLFENDLRKFIKKILQGEFRDGWWRGGIPAKVRASCAAKREEGLDEEKDLDLILFAKEKPKRGKKKIM